MTAEQITADSAAITAAKAAVAVAKQQLASTHLTSPISGIVAAVAIAKGDAVGASSSSNTITVVGTGALSVDLTIPLTKIDQVKVGQSAQVTVDGHTSPLPAKVTYVGGTATSGTSGTTTTYPVTVQLSRVTAGLYDGMGASVSIDTGKVTGALTVPLSALHTIGTRTVVETYSAGAVTATSVTLGVTGGDRVQIIKGLSAGQRLVIADLSTPVPSTTSTTTRGGRASTGSLAGLTGSGGFGGGSAGRFGGGGGFSGGGRGGN